MVTSTVNMKTGQIVCYKTGQIISSLHTSMKGVASPGTVWYVVVDLSPLDLQTPAAFQVPSVLFDP
jgi:hypothetical protein